MALQPPRINSIKSKYVSSCCTGFHKPCLDVSSPPDSLPSPPVVCVHVFLPFVLQDIFIKAAISKLPFIKTKQAKTNIRQQRGGLQTPSPATEAAREGGRGRVAAGLPRRGPRLSLQLRCHPFYRPHGYTQLWSAAAHQYNLYAFKHKFIYKPNTCWFYFMVKRKRSATVPSKPKRSLSSPGSSGKCPRRHPPFYLGWMAPSFHCNGLCSTSFLEHISSSDAPQSLLEQ